MAEIYFNAFENGFTMDKYDKYHRNNIYIGDFKKGDFIGWYVRMPKVVGGTDCDRTDIWPKDMTKTEMIERAKKEYTEFLDYLPHIIGEWGMNVDEFDKCLNILPHVLYNVELGWDDYDCLVEDFLKYTIGRIYVNDLYEKDNEVSIDYKSVKLDFIKSKEEIIARLKEVME